MKTKILTFAVSAMVAGLMLLGTSTAKAQMVPEQTVKAMVINAIEYPEYAIDKHVEGFVVVSFRATPEGKVEVTGINSSDPLLGDYVYETISSLDIPSAGDGSETIYLRFKFVLL